MKCLIKNCKNTAVCWKECIGFCDKHSPFSKGKARKNLISDLLESLRSPENNTNRENVKKIIQTLTSILGISNATIMDELLKERQGSFKQVENRIKFDLDFKEDISNA